MGPPKKSKNDKICCDINLIIINVVAIDDIGMLVLIFLTGILMFVNHGLDESILPLSNDFRDK